jgi:cytochrome c biogenesis protein CcmG/thiol:disulfide interchange protein DsbE
MNNINKGNSRSTIVTVIIVLMVVGAVFLTVTRKRDKYYTVTQGVEAPNFTLPNLDGKEVSLTDYRGKVVLLNLWATWCRPCIEEMPSMERLYQDFKNGDAPFEILAVNTDSVNPAHLKNFTKRLNVTFPIIYDTKRNITYTYKSIGVPESYILDKKGVIRRKIVGAYDWNREDARKLIEELIKE